MFTKFADAHATASTSSQLSNPIKEPASIQQICLGYDFLWILTTEGKIYGQGSNSYGQLGLGDADRAASLQEVPIDHKIRQISCGLFFSFAISENNALFVCGYNNFGQLGLSSLEHDQVPSLHSVDNMKNVDTVFAGLYHSACIDKQNQLFMTGCSDHGQVGNNIIGNQTEFVLSNLNSHLRLTGTKVVNVGFGFDHTALLLDDGSVFGCGSNYKGQLYKAASLDSNVKTLTPLQLPVRIVQIACSENTTICLDTFGDLYLCGSGNDIDMVAYSECKMHVLKLSEIDKRVKSVFARSNTLFAVLEDGTVLTRSKSFDWTSTNGFECPKGYDVENITCSKEKFVIVVDRSRVKSLFSKYSAITAYRDVVIRYK